MFLRLPEALSSEITSRIPFYSLQSPLTGQLGEDILNTYKESLKSANSDHLDKIGKSKRE